MNGGAEDWVSPSQGSRVAPNGYPVPFMRRPRAGSVCPPPPRAPWAEIPDE
jgi:hypothetical protein